MSTLSNSPRKDLKDESPVQRTPTRTRQRNMTLSPNIITTNEFEMYDDQPDLIANIGTISFASKRN